MNLDEYIISIINYNPETGIFTWSPACTHKKRVGSVGCVNSKGYVKIRINRVDIAAHRLAFLFMTGSMPDKSIQVDHINCIRHDNRWCNLRLATPSQNQRNEKLRRNNTSGIKGVSFDKKYGKWVARCAGNGGSVYLGMYSDIEKAGEAVAKFREKEHQEFCNHG